MDKQNLKFVASTKVTKKNRSLVVTISTKNPDRSRDVVMPVGMKTDNYMKNPVVAFGHDYRGLAIARTKNLSVSEDRIVADVEFPEEGVYPFADQVYRLYRDGFMNAWSIGFMPIKALDLESGGRQFRRVAAAQAGEKAANAEGQEGRPFLEQLEGGGCFTRTTW